MRRFIECLIPITACNLKCSYCYIIQEGRRKNEKAKFKYPIETIVKGLSQERLGGVSLINITGSGETLIPKELPEIVKGVLQEGHFVNITTNGTLSKQLDALLDATNGYHDHLHLSFSFHYVELLEKKLIDVFFENIKKAKSTGCSILLQINLSDEYVPHWEEIKELALKHVGAYPQVALTRDESGGKYSIRTKLSIDDYKRIGDEMNSPLFAFTCKNFNVKRREYCYAGLWSAKLNLCTGEMSGCYGDGLIQDIFKDITKPIRWCPIGTHCSHKYCINSSHFLSQGVIPELLPLPSYGELRNRKEAGWYTPAAEQFLYGQMEKSNPLLTEKEKRKYEDVYRCSELKKNIKRILRRFIP